MKKIEYVARSLSRSTRNVYENYVVNAIYHKINEEGLHIETQKSISSDEGKTYRIDMYLPQFKIAVEVNEPFHDNQKEEDRKRELDIRRTAIRKSIEGSIDFETIDIKSETTLEELNRQINSLVNKIKTRINEDGMADWIDDETKLKLIKEEGIIRVGDKLPLNNSDIVNMVLNKNLKGLQAGGYRVEKNLIWFPTIADYNNKNLEKMAFRGWLNYFNNEKNVIYEKSIDPVKQNDKRKSAPISKENKEKRIVFARERNSFGKYEKKFVGLFIASGWDSTERAERWEKYSDTLEFPIKEIL